MTLSMRDCLPRAAPGLAHLPCLQINCSSGLRFQFFYIPPRNIVKVKFFPAAQEMDLEVEMVVIIVEEEVLKKKKKV